MKPRALVKLIAGGLAALGFSACSALNTFDALVPKDKGAVEILSDAAFGPDPRQRVDIYRPAAGGRDLPIIVFIYGGSWNSGSKQGYSFVGRALASRGFVVAIPDYRLTENAPYPAFLEDNAAAVRYVAGIAGKLGGDPDRIVIAGHSAGAYNAAMLAFDPRWLGADRQRVKGFIGLAGPYDFFPFDTAVTRSVFGKAGNPSATQPVNFTSPDDPPAFIASAEKDKTVQARNSNALAAKLAAAGVPVERRRYPGIGHIGILTAIAKPFRSRAPVLDDMAAFARQVTKK